MRKRIWRVSPKGSADFASITAALADAVEGDLVLVGPGTYSQTSTGERFPLYVPPRVALRGTGAASCIIDGEGTLEWSWRPFRSDQSLVVIRDQSDVSGFTIRNSGGCGIAVSRSGHATISDNIIAGNALHGLLLSGVEDVVVRGNVFADNGKGAVSVSGYRPQPLRPGENIFTVCVSGHVNRVLIEDNDIKGSRDQESVTVAGDPDDDSTRAHVRIFDNRIATARVAVLLCGSFGASNGELAVELYGNEIRDAACGLIACAAYPVVRREARRNQVRLVARANVVRDCGLGAQVLGAFAPARDNRVDAELVDNTFVNVEGAAVRAVAALGTNAEATVVRNTVGCRILGTTVSNVRGRSLVLDGASMEVPGGQLAAENLVEAELGDNVWQRHENDRRAPILLRDGVRGNRAILVGAMHDHDRDDAIAMWWE